MKFAIFALLACTASAFTPPSMTFAVGKKAPVKKAATRKVSATKKVAPKKVVKKAATKKVVKKVVKKAPPKKVVKRAPAARKAAPAVAKSMPGGSVPSAAIPYETAPAILDGSMIGDVGFDPCYLSTKAEDTALYFNGLFGTSISGLNWYREAELMHGRIAQVAVVGFIAPGFGTFAGNEWSDSFGYTNPLEAISGAPSASLFQIFGFMSIMELRRISIILEDGNRYMPGDAQRWGQGPGRWNPFNFDYTPAEYAEKQLQELKHGRVAMIGLLGLIFQANASGVGIVDQLGAAFVYPDYVAKAGYFLPEGI